MVRTDEQLYYYKARLLRSIDGDTLELAADVGFGIGLTRKRFRLYGIDTPEKRLTTMTLGRAAQAALEAIVIPASEAGQLRLTTYVAPDTIDKADSFGRYLAELFVPAIPSTDPVSYASVNEMLVMAGHAVPYVL